MLAYVMNPCSAFLTHWSSLGNHGSLAVWSAYKFILLGFKYCSWTSFCITPSPQYPGPLPLDSWPSRCSLSGLSSRAIFMPALALSTAFMDTFGITQPGRGQGLDLPWLLPLLGYPAHTSTPLGHNFYLALFESSIQLFLRVADEGELNHRQLK